MVNKSFNAWEAGEQPTDTIRKLKAQRDELLAALEATSLPGGGDPCWCDGDAFNGGIHSPACQQARAAIAKAGESC